LSGILAATERLNERERTLILAILATTPSTLMAGVRREKTVVQPNIHPSSARPNQPILRHDLPSTA